MGLTPPYMYTLFTLFLLLTTLLTPTSANFHIGTGLWSHRACPSNQWHCNCFSSAGNDWGGSQVRLASGSLGDYFQVETGLCGVTRMLDFYKRPDGHWDFYQNNGNGNVEGTCYGNWATQTCPVPGGSYVWFDLLVCYSYICGT